MNRNKFGVTLFCAVLMCLFCTVSVWAQGMVPRYRLYNPNNFHHHYTSDQDEYNTLGSIGWEQEGIACYLYNEIVTIGSEDAVPYFRLYNPNSYEHHWTTDANEYNVLGTLGWIQEGADGYVFVSQVSGSEPLYRLYNPNDGLHHWTMDMNERTTLIGYGWVEEGIACFVFPVYCNVEFCKLVDHYEAGFGVPGVDTITVTCVEGPDGATVENQTNGTYTVTGTYTLGTFDHATINLNWGGETSYSLYEEYEILTPGQGSFTLTVTKTQGGAGNMYMDMTSDWRWMFDTVLVNKNCGESKSAKLAPFGGERFLDATGLSIRGNFHYSSTGGFVEE